MGTTIKQLANELGVSKPTISNVIVQLDMQDKLRRVGNRYILTETQIEQIKLYLSEDNEEKIHSQSQKLIKSPKTPNSQNDIMQKQLSALYDQLAIKDKQIQMLQEQFLAQGQILQEQLATKDKQIQLLQEQLIAKDNQIGQITVAMENLTASLNAEQALHAGTIQKQLAEHSVMEQTSDTEQSKQKQGFFARLFGKKEN